MVELKEKLKGRVLILGVGNPLKQDDRAGPHFVRNFKLQNPKSKHNVELLDAGVAPENYTGEIKKLKPDTLLVVDAIDFGGKPGSIKVFRGEEIGIHSFSTHNISLKTFIDFLKMDLPNLSVTVVGIQPKQAGFGENLSPEVGSAIEELCTNLA